MISGHRHGIRDFETERHAMIRITDIEQERLAKHNRRFEWQGESKSQNVSGVRFDLHVLWRLERKPSVAESDRCEELPSRQRLQRICWRCPNSADDGHRRLLPRAAL